MNLAKDLDNIVFLDNMDDYMISLIFGYRPRKKLEPRAPEYVTYFYHYKAQSNSLLFDLGHFIKQDRPSFETHSNQENAK